MPEVENDYVATATAEKRLREVLADRFAGTGPDTLDGLMSVLLAGAEITYLPRKKSVSIVLRVPATAKNGDGAATPRTEPESPGDGTPAGPAVESATGTPPPAAPSPRAVNPNGSDVPEAGVPDDSPYSKRSARFGLFYPADRVSEGDYFTE